MFGRALAREPLGTPCINYFLVIYKLETLVPNNDNEKLRTLTSGITILDFGEMQSDCARQCATPV